MSNLSLGAVMAATIMTGSCSSPVDPPRGDPPTVDQLVGKWSVAETKSPVMIPGGTLEFFQDGRMIDHGCRERDIEEWDCSSEWELSGHKLSLTSYDFYPPWLPARRPLRDPTPVPWIETGKRGREIYQTISYLVSQSDGNRLIARYYGDKQGDRKSILLEGYRVAPPKIA